MKNLKTISIATISTLAILGTSVFASTGIVNAPSGLVFRKEPSSASEPITTLSDDSKIDIIEKNGDWYKATYNNQEGYVYAKYVEVKENIPQGNTETSTETTSTTAQKKLKVYAIPVITSTVINEIEPEVQITVEKQITNWSYVTAGEISGWVRTYGIENPNQTSNELVTEEEPKVEYPEQEPKIEEPEQESEEPQKPEEETSNNTQPTNQPQTETQVEETKGIVNVDYANVRKEASTKSEIVTTLTKNTDFKITAETEEWYKIIYTSTDGTVYEGYIFKDLVTK